MTAQDTASKPLHSESCLRRHANDAACFPPCDRAVWLDEPVSRAQARTELLGELATWAHEQRLFAETFLRDDPAAREPGMPGWRQASARAGAVMAQDVFLDVRRRALAQQSECEEAVRRQERAAEKAAAGEREEIVAAAAPLPPAREETAGRPDEVVTVAVQEALL